MFAFDKSAMPFKYHALLKFNPSRWTSFPSVPSKLLLSFDLKMSISCLIFSAVKCLLNRLCISGETPIFWESFISRANIQWTCTRLCQSKHPKNAGWYFLGVITSVIGSAFTLVTFAKVLHPSVTRNYRTMIIAFIIFSTSIF